MPFYILFTKKFNNMTTQVNGYLKTLQILFIGLFTGPILFLGVCLFIQSGNQPVEQTGQSPLFFIAIGFAVIGIMGSRALYSSRIAKIQEMDNVKQKLENFRTAFIIRLALIEGPTLLCIVGLLVEEQQIFLYVAIVLILAQALNYPTKSKVANDIQISEAELMSN